MVAQADGGGEAGLWRVVGGADKGGLLVRRGKALTSEQESSRLSTGATVKALELDEEQGRLHYALLSGAGPAKGWVSVQLQGRALLEQVAAPRPALGRGGAGAAGAAAGPAGAEVSSSESEGTWTQEEWNSWWASQPWEPWAADGWSWDSAPTRESRMPLVVKAIDTRRPLQKSAVEEHFFGKGADAPPPPAAKPAAKELSSSALARKAMFGDQPIWAPAARGAERKERKERGCGHAGLTDCLAPAGDAGVRRLPRAEGQAEERRCAACRLPLGEVVYAVSGELDSFVHGECKVEAMLQQTRAEEAARLQREAAANRDRRAAYGIGWQPQLAPSAAALAERLGCKLGPGELSCLVLDSQRKTVSVVATSDPAAAVNLEYLALALQVRRSEGREPFFSLDPVMAEGDTVREGWQVKRYEPQWLRKTSLGEVLFQADYHLKELSMGAAEQPIVGLKNCFDRASERPADEEWSGREWFVVRGAEVQLTQDSVLLPRVTLAVEAREQLRGPQGLEDAPVTRPDHPLVRYAEDFSQGFELAAERRSVFHNLREVAKATVLAKFLLESDTNLSESWFQDLQREGLGEHLEIPQLWTARCQTEIQLQDGKINGWDAGIPSRMYSVYGGVQLGLQQFPLQEVVVAPARISRADMQPKAPGFDLSRSFIQSLAAGISPAQGVDLTLDRFNLSVADPSRYQPPQEFFPKGREFWRILDDSSKELPLLVDLFNPSVSDRRGEEDRFIPPEGSREHLDVLRRLLRRERQAAEARAEAFASEAFREDEPGAIFPSSWASAAVLRQATSSAAEKGTLQRLSTEGSRPNFERLLARSTPHFDRRTEGGYRFRIYRAGGYELRSIQGPAAAEELVAVFERKEPCADGKVAAQPLRSGGGLAADADVVKLVEFVEPADRPGAEPGLPSACRHFILVHTRCGGVLELRAAANSEPPSWREQPPAGPRSCLAKSLRVVEGVGHGAVLRDVRQYYEECTRSASVIDWRRFSDGLFSLVARSC